MTEHPVIFFPMQIQVDFQHHAVLCQRTGLIRTKDVHGAQILNRVQVFDDHLLVTHRHRPAGQGSCHDHGQHFRRKPDRDGQCEQHSLHPVMLCKTVHEKYHRDHHQHKADQNPGNRVDALVKGGLHWFRVQFLRHGAEHRVVADRNHDCFGTAADDRRTHEGDIRQVRCLNFVVFTFGELFHRFTFTGQRRLADEQVFCFQNADISRYHVACTEPDDIPADNFVDWDLLFAILNAFHCCGVCDHVQKFFRRITAPCFLNKAQDAADDHHGHNNNDGREIFFAGRCKNDIGKGGNYRQ